MKILLGSDNEKGIELGMLLATKGYEVEFLPIGKYPTVADNACYLMCRRKFPNFSILVCKTGIGMCIVANKFPGIRAVRGDCPDTVTMARRRNNCNILCLGSDWNSIEEMAELVGWFLRTDYEGESDQNLKLIKEIEIDVRRL